MGKIGIALFLIIGLLSCEEVIEVSDISQETVTLVAPTEAVTLNSANSLFFDWETTEDAEIYRIQIATPTFAEAIQIVADSTSTGTVYQTTLEANAYQWRVRAENSAYQTEYTTQSFTVE